MSAPTKRGKLVAGLRGRGAHESLLDREVDDEDELVGLCEGRFAGLKKAFTLAGGASMLVGDLRSYTEDALKELVKEKTGPWELLPPWLDTVDLRRLLRDSQSPAVAKKAKVAEMIPPVVFRADQGKSSCHFFI